MISLKIACVVLTLLIFMNPMLQPLITYNMPEIVKQPVIEPVDEPVVTPSIEPFISPVICPVLTRSYGGNTISHIRCNQALQPLSLICLQ